MARTEYIKLNDEPIEIEYVPDEHDESKDFEPSFWLWNKRYYLSDFSRLRNNPWIELYEEIPDYIHAVLDNDTTESFVCPKYLEIDAAGEHVNIYGVKED